MKKIIHVAGARPNFMKIAPILSEMREYPGEFQSILVHTGQHYDWNMSQIFFEELGLPEPDFSLGVGSGSHAEQTGRIMMAFEPLVFKEQPDLVVVVGDVNSTLACALTTAKLGIKVAHVEAGLRSFDCAMPEEINRIVTDHTADLLFTTEPSGNENLLREGIPQEKIHYVGNVMIDSLIRLLPKAKIRWKQLQRSLSCQCDIPLLDAFVLVTLHRPSNVDNLETLRGIVEGLKDVSRSLPVFFPIHPRTRSRIHDLLNGIPSVNLCLLDPLGYLDFLCLMDRATIVVTDSGGIQEETTYLGKSCLTVRPNTERPITVTVGTNRLVKSDRESLVRAVEESLEQQDHSRPSTSRTPDFWDGCTAQRIVGVIRSTPFE
jgi:UDP-N-acetylglucosamine 2-epimerase (non-hydrolysing)